MPERMAEGRRAGWRAFLGGLPGLLLVALALRAGIILVMGSGHYFGDTPDYDRAARAILDGVGPGPGFQRPPLYPAFMALGYALGGEGNYVAVRLLQLVMGLAVVALVYRLAERVGGARVGWIAGAFAAVMPTLVFITGLLYPSTLYTLLLLLATLAAFELSRRPSLPLAAGLGVLLTLSWMTDQIGAVPGAALVGWLAAAGESRGLRRAAMPAAVVAVALAAAIPWLQYQQRTYGQAGFLIRKADAVLHFARSDTVVYGVRAVRDPLADSAGASTAGGFLARELRYLRRDPAGYLGDYAREFLHFFQPLPDRITSKNRFNRPEVLWLGALTFAPILILAIAGTAWGRARLRDRLLLALVPLSSAAAYAAFFTQTRYRIPVEPHLIALAAMSLARFRPAPVSAAPAGDAPGAPHSPGRG